MLVSRQGAEGQTHRARAMSAGNPACHSGSVAEALPSPVAHTYHQELSSLEVSERGEGALAASLAVEPMPFHPLEEVSGELGVEIGEFGFEVGTRRHDEQIARYLGQGSRGETDFQWDT